MKVLVGILMIGAIVLEGWIPVVMAVGALVIARYEWPEEWLKFISIFQD